MKYKKIALLMLMLSSIILLFSSFIPATNTSKINAVGISMTKDISNEKRGIPNYDYIIGNDNWPHYRVFFWVPKSATHFTPYSDKSVNTDISNHGAVEKWSVVVTNEINVDSKLVFVYVPKTFVFMYGIGFETLIHLSYY
jgi:hypothetical protein